MNTNRRIAQVALLVAVACGLAAWSSFELSNGYELLLSGGCVLALVMAMVVAIKRGAPNAGAKVSRGMLRLFIASGIVTLLCFAPSDATLYLTALPGAIAALVCTASGLATLAALLGLDSGKA